MFAAMSWFRSRSRKAPIFICLACTALVAGLYYFQFQPLQKAEFYTQDCLARSFGKRAKPDPRLVYLAIDRDSIQLDQFDPAEVEAAPALRLMKQGWPWSRAIYPLILERLFDAGAKVVALDLMFPTPREGDVAFRAALDKYRDRVVIGCNFVLASREKGGANTLQLPAETLIPQSSPLDGRIGFVNFWPDSDEVIRHARYGRTMSDVFGDPPEAGEEVIDSFAAKILRKMGRPDLIPPPGARHIRFAGPSETFTPRSVCDLFDEKKWKSPEYDGGKFFRDKIVVIGPEGNFLKDVVRTPFEEMPGPELHLNALNAALGRDFIFETTGVANLLLIAAAGLGAWALCMRFPAPLLRFSLLAAAGAAWLACAQLFYNRADLYVLAFGLLANLGSSGVSCLAWDFFIERREKLRVRRTLERYVSKDAVREIIDNPQSFFQTLGGVRKPVAILFTDLRGFTTISEQADSQALLTQLNEYFGVMVEPVLANHGFLDKFIGDAIMAAWGTIQSRGAVEDVRGAIVSTLRMREGLAALNARWKAEGKTPLAMGMGVNYGEVIVGNVGSHQQMNLTLIGDTVNLASRIEGVTKEYGIDLLVGEDAAALVRDFFYLQSAGLVQVKNRKRPVELFTVLGERNGTPDAPLDAYLRIYADAMALYVRGDFTAAGARFEEARALRPPDPLPPVYIKRCALLAQQPPGPDWNGVFVMTNK